MSYEVSEVAKYIIWYYDRKGSGISNLVLQKVMYFAQAQFLVSFDSPLFQEDILALGFGPIVKSVYTRYLPYGNGDIPVWQGKSPLLQRRMSRKEHRALDGLLDRCIPYSATDLLDIVWNQKPWKDAYYQGDYTRIELSSLKDFFKD